MIATAGELPYNNNDSSYLMQRCRGGSACARGLIYSLVLLAVIVAAGRELISVWTRGKFFLSEFSYFSDGKKDVQRGERLREETIRIYRMIIALMRVESESTKIVSDEGLEGADTEKQLPLLQNLFTNKVEQFFPVEIAFQGLSIKAALSTLSNFVAPQNTEIGAAIFADQQRRVFISVTGTPAERRQLGIFADLSPEHVIESGASDAETAFRIGCFLVWIQWDKTEDIKAPDPDQGISFDEFCNWAKILVNKNRLQLTDPYRLPDEVKKNTDLGFIKTQFVLAANLKLGYQAMYASLHSLVPYVKSEGIDLGDGAETAIDSLADVIRLFSLMENSSRDRDEPAIDWRHLIKESDRTRPSVNRAYFAPDMFTDCNAPADLSGSLGSSIKNVIRIVPKRKGRVQRVGPAFVALSGLIFADNDVLTTFRNPRFAGSTELGEIFVDAEVKVLHCGETVASYKVAAARYLDTGRDLPFVRLEVPGLKLQEEAPTFDFEDTEFVNCVLVGHVRDTNLLFAEPRKWSLIDRGETNNEVTQVWKGKALQTYGNATSQRRLIGVPFANGLRGSPVFNEHGEVVAMVDSGRMVSLSLALPVATSVAPLKELLGANSGSVAQQTRPVR
jgi:hypothetical protein